MLPTVKDLCTLHEGAMRMRVGDGIERIEDECLNMEAGRLFLSRSHLTGGMKELVREGFKRLSGISGSRSVFRLKQAMGGGKTHLLRTMAYLARHTDLRTEFFPQSASAYPFGEAKVCFFYGREQPDDFFWGRLAAQMGQSGIFQSGTRAPGENHWHELFDRIGQPVLILLDEMPTYFGYYRTQQAGQGTVADIAGRAFANLLSCGSSRKDICIVVSDLEASHVEGTQYINAALENARKELSRVEFNIVPVDLSGDETYSILKKRLFASLPDTPKIEHIADQFAKAMGAAQQSKTADLQKSPEQLAAEVVQTYPFHPQMKHLFALFKENKEFQQTRGLMELASRLVRSVWERKSNDVLLIGPQHFDLSIEEVREKLVSISRLDDAVARDIYSDDYGAHAQTIDANAGNDCAMQVANLLLTASLSTAVNPIRGLRPAEIMSCLVAPNADLAYFRDALESLRKSCWYLHKSPEERIYFDKVENLKKMLEGLAEKAPEPKVHELVAHRLQETFAPKRKVAYVKVMALPMLDQLQAEVQSGRVLAIAAPDSKLPPEEMQKFFAGLVRKNNLVVLTGEKTFEEGRLWEAARMVYACGQAQAQKRVERGGPQWEEFEDVNQEYDQHFTGILKSLFDKLFFPFQRASELEPSMVSRPLEQVGNTTDGEARIEATLQKDPVKLLCDWSDDQKFSMVRSRLEKLFRDQAEANWADIKERAQTDCAMYFLPPGDIEKIKLRACNEGKWDDLGNGWVSKAPKPKEATVQFTPIGKMGDDGGIILEVLPVNSNPETTHVHYADEDEVSNASPRLTDTKLVTKALRISFLAVDLSGKCPSAKPIVWKNKLVIQHEIKRLDGERREVTLRVLPRHTEVRYTLNGAEPRNGTEYTKPFEVDGDAYSLLVFAEAEGLEAKQEFRVPMSRRIGCDDSDDATPPAEPPPTTRPVVYPSGSRKTVNSRDRLFALLEKAKQRGVIFREARFIIAAGQDDTAQLQWNGKGVPAEKLSELISGVTQVFDLGASVSLQFNRAKFQTGQDLIDLCNAAGLELANDWVESD
jgi:hypothetical protein